MAGDWIKVEATTPDKPEVYRMAAALQLPAEHVVGALFRIWIWADQQSVNGNAISVTETVLDNIARVTGLANVMREVGWLSGQDGHLSLPHFDRHNGKTAKSRALTVKRVQRLRNAVGVTDALPEKRREEKRNQDQKKRHAHSPAEPFTPKDSTRAWAEKKGFAITWDASLEYFNSYRAANGKSYLDLDDAFMNCLRADWGHLRQQAGARTVRGAAQHEQVACGNCSKPITGAWSQSPKGRVCDPCWKHYHKEGKWA